MDVQKEMNKWKKERKKFLPVVHTLLTYYDNKNLYDSNIEITDTEEVLTIAKMIDIGYIDGKTVVLDKVFETIEKVIYTKQFPLTQKGEEFYQREMGIIKNKLHRLKRIRFFLIIGLLIGFLVALLYKLFM